MIICRRRFTWSVTFTRLACPKWKTLRNAKSPFSCILVTWSQPYARFTCVLLVALSFTELYGSYWFFLNGYSISLTVTHASTGILCTESTRFKVRKMCSAHTMNIKNSDSFFTALCHRHQLVFYAPIVSELRWEKSFLSTQWTVRMLTADISFI